MAKALGSDDEGLSDPSSDETNRDQDTAIHHHMTVKRPRADSSPAAKAASKRRCSVKSAAKPKVVMTNVGARPPRPTQSSKQDSSCDDMDIDSDDDPESEDGDRCNDEDKVIGQDGDCSKRAASPMRGKSVGKWKAAVSKLPSLRTPSAALCLGKDIPAIYEPLDDPLAEDELFELDWSAPAGPAAPQGKASKKGKTKLTAPVSAASVLQKLPTRHWHSFSAPQMALNPELEVLGEVELSDAAFRFPFYPQVIKWFSPSGASLIDHIIARARSKSSASRQ